MNRSLFVYLMYSVTIAALSRNLTNINDISFFFLLEIVPEAQIILINKDRCC